MASEKIKGIIVESKDFKDKDKLVKIYTLEKGIINASFRGVRTSKSKLKAMKDVFVFGDFFIESVKGFNIVTGVDVIENFFALSQNLDKFYESCSIVNIIKQIATNEKNPQLFLTFIKSLKTIAFGNIQKDYVFIKFCLKVLENSGFAINFEKCSSCKAKITGKKFLNLDFGEIVCSNCKNAMSLEISNPAFSAMKIISGLDFEKLATLKISQTACSEILKILTLNMQERFSIKINIF